MLKGKKKCLVTIFTWDSVICPYCCALGSAKPETFPQPPSSSPRSITLSLTFPFRCCRKQQSIQTTKSLVRVIISRTYIWRLLQARDRALPCLELLDIIFANLNPLRFNANQFHINDPVSPKRHSSSGRTRKYIDSFVAGFFFFFDGVY